jgi:phage-related protein
MHYIAIDITMTRETDRAPGRQLDDLRGFPADARRQAGYQLDRV